jgi:hypothetical protein
MPTLTTQYVYFGSDGAHTRQPRATTSYGGFTPIPGLNPSGTATLASGTPFQPGPAEPTLIVGTLTLAFAFTNVSGCTEGARTSYVAATQPPVGTVGTNPILVLYVYLPTGGGNGGSGAVIDAFDETAGTLVDNDFVSVSPDPGGTLTTEANVDGWVDTSSSGYTITADHPNIGPYLALPTTAQFVQWVDLADPAPPATLVSGANLTPAKGVTVYALAFYMDPPVKTTKEALIVEKNPKERIKEWDKEHPKEFPDKVPADVHPSAKSLVTEGGLKGPKESVELPPGSLGGGPSEASGALSRLSERVARLEASFGLRPRGAAFIKSKDRPPVGKAKPKKPGNR